LNCPEVTVISVVGSRVRTRAASFIPSGRKVDKADEAYFSETIAPLLDRSGVEFGGEINDRDKVSFSAARWRCCSRSTGPNLSGMSQ
jgi:hypothetical protein